MPEDIEALILQRAAAAGFPGQVEAYVVHLVKADETEDYGAPDGLSADVSVSELDSLISAGFESGPASPMTQSDWQELHNRINDRQDEKIENQV